MSWLDDMEAADPAYPDPDTAAPGHVSHDLPAGTGATTGEQAYGASARAGHPGLYDLHARLDSGHLDAVRALIADWTGSGQASPGRDWHQIRDAEARARDAGLRVSVPQPDGQGSPEYQADAAAWGTGRGIGADGPEAVA
jgi:hypothetical protein